jgi:hypothetical protein
MAIQQTLRPFRDYNEKDVVNLFAYSGGALVDTTYQILATKGTVVKINSPGVRLDLDPENMIGNMGLNNVNNFVGQRYGVTYTVTAAGPADNAIGILLFDVRELDENGEFLKYRPQKAAEMEAVLSGQAVPIATVGTFLYSGISTGGQNSTTGTPVVAGGPVYVAPNGGLCTTGTTRVGRFYGSTGVTGAYGDGTTTALVKLDFN